MKGCEVDHNRLVRVSIYENGEMPLLGYVWGLLNESRDGRNGELFILYSRSKRALDDLGASVHMATDLSHCEIGSAVDVDECWTPGCVYAEAAKRALNGG